MNVKAIDRHAKKSFENTYQCLQLANICVLYETFDFNEQKVKDITFEFAKYDKQDSESGTADLWTVILKYDYGFDCRRFARDMPYPQKVKLAVIPKNIHDQMRRNHMIANVEQAVYTYFSVMMWTLKESCGFGKEDFERYLEGFWEICKLFPKGMTLKWMIDFVENEIGWGFEKSENSTACCEKINGGK